jgi:hypothetical protein
LFFSLLLHTARNKSSIFVLCFFFSFLAPNT